MYVGFQMMVRYLAHNMLFPTAFCVNVFCNELILIHPYIYMYMDIHIRMYIWMGFFCTWMYWFITEIAGF